VGGFSQALFYVVDFSSFLLVGNVSNAEKMYRSSKQTTLFNVREFGVRPIDENSPSDWVSKFV
jgi:hypothetical protein